MEIQFSQSVPGLSSTLGAVLQGPWMWQPGRACRAQTQGGSCSPCHGGEGGFLRLWDEWCQVSAFFLNQKHEAALLGWICSDSALETSLSSKPWLLPVPFAIPSVPLTGL